MESFAQLLIKLNRVWRAREKATCERVRLRAGKRIGELRRRLAQQTPYDSVLQHSEVERLKRELRELRTTYNAGRRKLNDQEEKLLDTSLESVESLSAQARPVALCPARPHPPLF